MADATLADLSDSEFVEECWKALNALRDAVVDAEAAEMTKPYVPEKYIKARRTICSLMPRVREFASSRLNNLAEKYGISGVGNWLVEFHDDISENKLQDLKAQYISVVFKRYNAINKLRNIIQSDTASGSGNLIDRLVAGPDDVVLDSRDLALLEAYLKQPVSLSTVQKEKQQTGRSATQYRRNKLRLIRDFNVGLQQKEYPPGEVPLDAGTIVSAQGMLANISKLARANNVVHGMVIEAFQPIGGKPTLNDIQTNPNPAAKTVSGSPKISTERGVGRAKLIAALTKHHNYAEGGCPNLEPIGNNELARMAQVSPATATRFFNKWFHSHADYRAICLRNTSKLCDTIKSMNLEFVPAREPNYGTVLPDES